MHALPLDVDHLVVSLFEQEGQSLVRLARLFVDDRNAAEDLVQEAFIRLARSAHRIKDESKAAPYLRSIVLNLARDNNRRGLVSLRHHLPQDDRRASTEDEIELREDQQRGDRRAARAPAPTAQRARAPLLRGARDRRHRRGDGDLPQLGQDASPARARRARAAARRRDDPIAQPAVGAEVTRVTAVEQRLRDALFDEADALDESDDLFARVTLSIEDDRTLRRQRRRRLAVIGCLVGAIAAVVFATTERTKGELVMDWWVLELLWFAGMVFLALWLGPFIRRFGKSYAADVFRANPRTGKSFIVLMDVAYYLIFFAFILFTVQFEPDAGWGQTVNAAQLQAVTVRLGGILLIVGLLHGLNVLMLPIIGRILTLNRRLDEETPPPETRARNGLIRPMFAAAARPVRARAGGAVGPRPGRDRAAHRRAARGTQTG